MSTVDFKESGLLPETLLLLMLRVIICFAVIPSINSELSSTG